MENLYTDKLKNNNVFKNYKELCGFLNEPIKNGNSKKSQLKEWERYFSYRKDGNKFIIMEIFDVPKDKIDNRVNNYSGNITNVKPLMDYLISEFDTNYINRYFTISNWSTTVLHLMNKEICDKVYKEEKELIKYCEVHKILDLNFFRTYIGIVKYITKNLITTSFRGLQKRELVTYEEGYSFRYEGAKEHRNICVSSNVINEYIDNKEREICEQLIYEYFPNKKIKGKQLVYILQHSDKKDILKLYNKMCINAVNDSNDICCAINDAIMDRDVNSPISEDFVDGTDGCRILSYHKCYRITSFNKACLKKNKQEVIDTIQMLAIKHVKNIKHTNRLGKEYYPYDNEEYLNEIEKINKVLFKNDTETILMKYNIYEKDDELDAIFGANYKYAS